MCGIAGIYDTRSGSNERLAPVLECMLDLMAHRGPDDRGSQHLQDLLLGHLRLSILDLSPRGHQPMSIEEGRYWISYNGEVYNYLELREELEADGIRFRSDTDTEVILQAFRRWGLDCFRRFNGMWALAIYDRRDRRLVLSRDRVGIKPLYWTRDRKSLAFASEIKALAAFRRLAGMELALNPNSLGIYLNQGLVDGLEDTFFKDIQRFKAGHFMVLQQGRILAYQPYWDLPALALEKRGEMEGQDERHLARELFAILEDAVAKHSRSDVKVGVCLSGGLDSSCVAGLASRVIPGLETFTSWFKEGDEYNELEYARQVQKAFGFENRRTEVPGGELLDKLPGILWYLDEPTLAMGIYPQWHVMERASREVTVVMDGQGGDEIFAGYDFYAARFLYSKLLEKDTKTYQETLAGFYRNYGLGRVNQLGQEVKQLFLGRAREQVPDAFPGHLDNFLLQELSFSRLPALLRYEDRLSMAFSIESRVPLLDHRLLEFAFALPEGHKLGPGWSKYLMRQALEGFLPQDITWRKDKKGFPTPFALWAEGEHKKAIRGLLQGPDSWMPRLLDPRELDNFFAAWDQGRRDHWQLWRFLSLELWLRTWLDRLGREIEAHLPGGEDWDSAAVVTRGLSPKPAEMVVTMDYETFDTNDYLLAEELEIDWQRTVIEPTERFARLLEKHGVPLTVLWNTCEYFWLEDNGQAEAARAIREQLQDLVRRGHDVQLHLHPAWASVRRREGKWIWQNPGITVPTMKAEDFEALVERSVRTMEELFQPIRPDYRVRGFRGRSYEVEPFRAIAKTLLRYGIRADSSYHGQGPVPVRHTKLQAHMQPREADFLEYPIYAVGERRWDFSGPPQFATLPLETLQQPPGGINTLVMIGHCKQAIHYQEVDRCLSELKRRFGDALKAVRWQESIEARLAELRGDWVPEAGFSQDYFEGRWQEPDPFHSQALDDPYYQKLLELLPRDIESLLDLGCAEGGFTAAMAQESGARRVVGVDISPTAVARARQSYPHLEFLQRDLLHLRLDERFDCIVASQNLYYFNPAERWIILANLEAMLAEGGRVVLAWWTGARRGFQEDTIEEEVRNFFDIDYEETHHAGSTGAITGDHRILVGRRRLSLEEEELLNTIYWRDKKVLCRGRVGERLTPRFAWKSAAWQNGHGGPELAGPVDVLITTASEGAELERLRPRGTLALYTEEGQAPPELPGVLWIHRGQRLWLGAKSA